MDPSTASYYRAILFSDGTDQRPLPVTLVQLHGWAVKRNAALGLGGMITKAVALSVAMTWLSSTKEGRQFSQQFTNLGDLFCGPLPAEGAEETEEVKESEGTSSEVSTDAWDTLPAESQVVVTMQSGAERPGNFIGRKGNWVEVRINGEVSHHRISKVKIVGA